MANLILQEFVPLITAFVIMLNSIGGIDIIETSDYLSGEVVKMIFLLELAGLEGRKLLEGYDVASVAIYEGK